MVTFVALGDSTTAGYGDPMPGGGWRGWARLLADGLGDVAFHNLARSGALAVDVVRDQLPDALDRAPQLASVVVGVNDTLRSDFDVAVIGATLNRIVGRLDEAGALVLTACLPDPGRMFGLPGALARPLGRRIAAVNAVIHAVAAPVCGIHLHIPDLAGVYDPRMWSIDRLHPGERGHRLLAGAYFDLLAAHGFPVHQRPDPEPTNPPPTTREQMRWLATEGTRWFYRRSTDLVPQLARMAVAEWWYHLRGIEPQPHDQGVPQVVRTT
ncbi:SGNH/GDSL hydrolase family protein [Actinomycetes bacterium KLBMP 9797]